MKARKIRARRTEIKRTGPEKHQQEAHNLIQVGKQQHLLSAKKDTEAKEKTKKKRIEEGIGQRYCVLFFFF